MSSRILLSCLIALGCLAGATRADSLSESLGVIDALASNPAVLTGGNISDIVRLAAGDAERSATSSVRSQAVSGPTFSSCGAPVSCSAASRGGETVNINIDINITIDINVNLASACCRPTTSACCCTGF